MSSGEMIPLWQSLEGTLQVSRRFRIKALFTFLAGWEIMAMLEEHNGSHEGSDFPGRRCRSWLLAK